MSNLVMARTIEGVLYIEAAKYQELCDKNEELNAAYDELHEKYVALSIENQELRTPDED